MTSASNTRKSSGARHRRRTSAHASKAYAIVDSLRQDIGDETLGVVLETVRSYLHSTWSHRRGVEGRAAAKAANKVRLETLRALILNDTISSDEVRAYVHRSRPIINKMAKEGQLLAILDGRVLRFPRWQFDPDSESGIVPHLADVLKVMDASPFRKAAWFVTENPRLRNRKPLDILRAGNVGAVVDEARALVGS
jgi:hypothetical protein